jgi:rod shape-determining protein MreC
MARTSRTGTRTDLALLGAALALAFAALILPAAVRGKVQGSLRSSVAAPLVAAQAWAERGRQAIGDHGRLVTKVDSLALGSQSSAPLRAENERLRALLGLGQRLQWGFVATEVVQPPRGGDEHTVLLAAGSAAGVRPFSPLVVPEGLIGMVTAVDASSSTAILWTHPDFRASATTPDGVAFGIVAAHLGSGADRFLLEMRGVPFRSELKPGTLIVSSGLGNVFPRGIPIGIVLRETKTVEGWARTYLIRPIVSPDAASAAMVLLPPRAAAGVTGAWSSATSSEGTQKSIAAAGDSLLADSVRHYELQLAKLALLDSLRRVAIFRGDSTVRVESDSLAKAPAGASTAPTATPAVTPPVPAGTTPAARPAAATNPVPKPAGTIPVAMAAVVPKASTAPRVAAAPVSAAPSATQPVVAVRAPTKVATADPRRTGATADSAQGRNASGVLRVRPRINPAKGKLRSDTSRTPENPFRLPPAGGPA